MSLQLHFNEVLIEHCEAHHLFLFHCCSLSTEHMKLHHLLLFTAAQSSTRMVCHTLSTMEWRIFRPHLHSIPLAVQLQQQLILLACTVSIVLTEVWMQNVHTHTHTVLQFDFDLLWPELTTTGIITVGDTAGIYYPELCAVWI